MHTSARLIPLFFTCLALSPLAAEEPAKAPDFTQGFAKFYELGLPRITTNAAYVKLDARKIMLYNHDITTYELRLAGNAWMLSEATNRQSGRFVINNCSVAEVEDQQAFQQRQMAKFKEQMKEKDGASIPPFHIRQLMDNEDGGLTGRWRMVDVKKDIDKIIAFLKKKNEAVASNHDPLAYSGGYGKLLLMSIHFHAAGFTNEANTIVSLLFEAAGDQRKVLIQGLNQLADQRYQEITQAFFSSGNWQSYATDMERLMTQFAAAWKKAPAIQRLLERVKARIAQPAPPALSGEGLTDEDLSFAGELAVITNQLNAFPRGMHSSLWILPATQRRGMPPPETNVLTSITARGLGAIPLLLALAQDDYLTQLDKERLSGFSSHSIQSFASDEAMSEEYITQTYDSLSRPATRSEVAMVFLAPLVKRDENEHYPPNRDEVIETVRAWYAEHKDQPPLELARFYLKEGDAQQQNAAVQYLIQAGASNDIAALEDYLMNSENPMITVHLAQQYVQQRKEKARDFVERFTAQMTNQLAAGNNEMFRQDDVQRMIKLEIDTMKETVSATPTSFEASLAELSAGTKTMDELGPMLYRSMATRKPAELLPVLLQAAVDAKSADLSVPLLQLSMSLPYIRQAILAEEAGAQAVASANSQKTPELDIKNTADLWNILLADTRVSAEPSMFGSINPGSVADMAALAIEVLYDAESRGDERRELMTAADTRVKAIILARARTRLAGKPPAELPPLPSADNVTAEQRQAMAAELLKTAPAEMESKITALNVDQILALAAMTEDNEELNRKLLPLANRVKSVDITMEQGVPPKELDTFKGQELTKAMIETCQAACRQNTEKGLASQISLTRQPCLNGVTIKVQVFSPTNTTKHARGSIQHMRAYTTKKQALVTGTLMAEALYAAAMWPVAQKPSAAPAKPEVAATNTGDELLVDITEDTVDISGMFGADHSDFWEKTEEFCSGKGNVLKQAVIIFMGTPILPDNKE